jgi:hypothetical protein
MIQVHLKPNWSASVSETLEYKTSIFTTTGGKEQRQAERSLPRRSLKFTSLMGKTAIANFNALLQARGTELLAIADPAREPAETITTRAAGATTITVDDIPSWMIVGAKIVIQNKDRSHFATVSALNATTKVVTFAPALQVESVLGALVRPRVEGRMSKTSGIAAITTAVATSQVTFQVEPGSPKPDITDLTIPTYGGRPVLNVAPNWSNGIESTSDVSDVIVDYDRGIPISFLSHDMVQRTTQFNYLARKHGSVGQVAELFMACKGRLGEFWCPTWVDDFEPAAGFESGDTSIRVQGRHIADNYAASKTHKAIAIRLSDDTWIYRQISFISVSGSNPGAFSNDYSKDFYSGESVIGVSSPFTRTAHLAEEESVVSLVNPLTMSAGRLEIAAIYWLQLCRFASDQLTIKWHTDSTGSIATGVVALEYLPVETLA